MKYSVKKALSKKDASWIKDKSNDHYKSSFSKEFLEQFTKEKSEIRRRNKKTTTDDK